MTEADGMLDAMQQERIRSGQTWSYLDGWRDAVTMVTDVLESLDLEEALKIEINAYTERVLVRNILDGLLEALCDVATSFACSEADDIATLYQIVGRADLGEAFLADHARGDVEDEDSHRV